MRCPSCGSEVPDGFRFCGYCGANIGAPVAQEKKVEPPGMQRREVAVLFADLSGFTALSEKLDPEDVHELMNRCFAGIGAAIQDEGGYIDKYIGDNVMALFGAPVAHEDDPARACRAALAIHEFIDVLSQGSEREHGAALRMRIGVHFGLVLAGGVGSEVKMDYTVMGDTVNLASRLESAAAPGTVLVSEEIHRHTEHEFKFGPARELTVKGKEHPVRAFELLRESMGARASRVAAAPLIGRDKELAELRERIQAARPGSRWIEVRGDMGTGKSRVVREAIASVPERWLVQVVATPAICRRPFGLLRRMIYVTFADLLGEPIANEERFTTALKALSTGLETYAKALWYLAAPSRQSADVEPTEDPLSFRRTIERGLFTFLEAIAARFPNAVLFLDAYEHADDASLELLHSAPQAEWPLPIITAARVGVGPPAAEDGTILLAPLDEESSEQLLTELLHDADVPEAFRRNIGRRAAGVPLFLEEIVRSLVEAGELIENAGGQWLFKASTEEVQLPSSLRSAMVSRLDRLPTPEQELLGFCSVQGVEFGLGVTERVWQMRGRANSEGTFESLARKGFVRLTGSTGVFLQPLMQEACYQMLVRRERRDLHETTATALCDLAGGPTSVSPDVLVFHYENSSQWERAAEANLRAADRAQDLFLNDDALVDYDRVLLNLENAGATSDESRQLKMTAHAGAARVHLRLGRYAAAEERTESLLKEATTDAERAEGWRLGALVRLRTGRADEAQQLLDRVVTSPEASACATPDVISLAWYALAELHHRAGRLDEAVDALRCCRATAAAPRSRTTLGADLLGGQIAHTRGEFAEAAEHYQRALNLARELGSVVERARAINNLGNVARDEGKYEAAHARYQAALRLWQRIGDTECIAGGHNNAGNLALSRGDFRTARQNYLESLAACQQIGNVHGVALAHANLGILALEENDGAAAIEAANASLEVLAGAANDILRGLVEGVLGDAQLLVGNLDGASSSFEKVLAGFSDSTHPLAVATATRGLARVAARRARFADAQELFAKAITGFQRLKRSQEETRTLLDVAKVFQQTGDLEGARSHAEQALARFKAIHAELDAERARQLLEEIDDLCLPCPGASSRISS